MKKGQIVKHDLSFLVTRPGFEPRLSEPESEVLPLYYRAMKKLLGNFSGGKYTNTEAMFYNGSQKDSPTQEGILLLF